MRYAALRLYRYVSADERAVRDELGKLAEYIKSRSSKNKSILYALLTYTGDGRAGGLLIIGSRDDSCIREIEHVADFIKTNFTSISAEEIGQLKDMEGVRPSEVIKNFLSGVVQFSR